MWNIGQSYSRCVFIIAVCVLECIRLFLSNRFEFDELVAMKKDSAPGPDGSPYGAYRCAGGLGSQFLLNAYRSLMEGGTVTEHSAESRTVFVPKTSDIDDKGRIIRSRDPLTLCNCDCKLLASAICRGLHWYTMRCIHPSQTGSCCVRSAGIRCPMD